MRRPHQGDILLLRRLIRMIVLGCCVGPRGVLAPAPPCPVMECDEWREPPASMGLFAMIVSGHLRSIEQSVSSMHGLTAANPGLEVYFHVWADPNETCDAGKLEKVRRIRLGAAGVPAWGVLTYF